MIFNLKIVRRINFFVAGSLPVVYLGGKIWSGKRIRKNTELKKDDTVVLLPTKLNSLIEDVLKDIKSRKQLVHEVEPFLCSNVDIKTYGASVFGFKISLGIPYYFLHDSVNEADFILMVNNKEIPRDTPDYNYLKMYLCLSADAKKFAIASQIYAAQYSEIIMGGALPIFIVMSCNFISFLIEKFVLRMQKPNLVSYHVAVYILGIWLFFFVHGVISSYVEGKSDFLVAELGTPYVKGGIEYYEKVLRRNKILRKIDSSLPITGQGEIKSSLFRLLQIPVSRRITYLKDISKAKNPSVWNYFF